MTSSRREFVLTTWPLLMTPAVARAAVQESPGGTSPSTGSLPPSFPAQDPELVREMVTVAHGNLVRVKELVAIHQTLAKATYDWGFGDWESGIDAASHVGNRPIAEFLLANGARPTIFSAAMLGQLDAVKAYITASPGIETTKGPHSITLMKHAMAGGARARAVVEYLASVPGSDQRLAELPVAVAELTKLAGTYAFGRDRDQRIEIAISREQLTFAHAGRTRPLYHLGAFEFYPAGAETVRIRFTEADGGFVLTVNDPGPIVSARRAD